MEHYIQLTDVSKIYKMGEVEIRALSGMNFFIEKGEFVVIVGPSGAGKTTVLNILGGMDTATDGKVVVDGVDVSALRSKQLVRYRREEIRSIEVDLIMFGRSISLLSYFAGAALTMAFSVLINLAMYKSLKKIDMIESLKSIE